MKPEDERIYATVRMGFALVVLLNLLFMWPDRQVFLSDAGLSESEVVQSQARWVYLSVFGLGGSEVFVTGVMLVTAVALVMLLTGTGARLAAIWVFVWHVSYRTRTPLTTAGWDFVLQSFSFLVMISPLGKYWTLGALVRRGEVSLAPVPRYGLVLMRLQVVVIYWQAVLSRLVYPAPYWRNGEFLSYYMLSHHSRWPGGWVLEQGDMLTLATFGIQLSELAIPVLLWIRKTRWWGALLGAVLHAGIAVVTFDIFLFSLSMVMTYLCFLRKEDVERLERWMARWSKRGAMAPAEAQSAEGS